MGELEEGGSAAVAVGVSDMWHVTLVAWHVTRGTRQVTHDIWHKTQDKKWYLSVPTQVKRFYFHQFGSLDCLLLHKWFFCCENRKGLIFLISNFKYELFLSNVAHQMNGKCMIDKNKSSFLWSFHFFSFSYLFLIQRLKPTRKNNWREKMWVVFFTTVVVPIRFSFNCLLYLFSAPPDDVL